MAQIKKRGRGRPAGTTKEKKLTDYRFFGAIPMDAETKNLVLGAVAASGLSKAEFTRRALVAAANATLKKVIDKQN